MGLNEEHSADSKTAIGSVGSIINRVYPLVSILFLLSYLGSMIIGIYAFFFTSEGIDFSSNQVYQLALYIFYYSRLNLPGPFNSGLLFLLLSLIFAAAFIIAGFSNTRYCTSVKTVLRSNVTEGIFSNFLMAMPVITSTTFVSISLVQLFEEKVGVPVGEIVFPNPFQEILFTSYAAFIEEISFRLMPIAFPVAVYLLFQSSVRISNMSYRKRLLLVPLALFKPESFKQRMGLGGDRSLDKLKAMLIVISAVMFSYAHVASGAWESGKLITTFMGGLVLGYCCLRYGWESALLVHWFFNSYWSVLSYASGLDPLFAVFYDSSFLMNLYLGFTSLIAFAIALFLKINARKGKVRLQ